MGKWCADADRLDTGANPIRFVPPAPNGALRAPEPVGKMSPASERTPKE